MTPAIAPLKEYPPNIRSIEARFGPRRHGTIYTYAPFVYVPSGVPLTPSLEAHEAVHLRQQGTKPKPWWNRYLQDDAFRLAQELEAHRAEWRALGRVKDRARRHRHRIAVARRLASPLYGSMMSVSDALGLLRT